jgi:hypothetical protein
MLNVYDNHITYAGYCNNQTVSNWQLEMLLYLKLVIVMELD